MTSPVPPALTDYPAVRHYLYSLKHHGAKFGIDRMRLLSEKLGHPERRFPIVHVAGTNGKGSVAAMLETIVRRAGYRTGLYTSPHLVRQGERVQVDRRILAEDEIVRYTRELQPIAAALGAVHPDDHPSFFEFMTAMAFLHFARERVDLGIIEVGMGGRLDATNVVDPLFSIITTIGHDHMEILGDTLAKVAAEKAGIIKPHRPVVIGQLPAEADAVVRRIAGERGSALHEVAVEFGTDIARYPATKLEGSFQRHNAAVATLAARQLRPLFQLPEENIRAALLEVEWPGRWQHVRISEREIIFDAAHNPEGAECLEENLARLVHETGQRPDVVVGVLGTPRAAAIIPTVARYACALHLVTVPHQPRSCSVEELAAFVPPDFSGTIHRGTIDEIFPAARTCTVGESQRAVIVTGSIYLLGEAMDRLLHDVPYGQGLLQDGAVPPP